MTPFRCWISKFLQYSTTSLISQCVKVVFVLFGGVMLKIKSLVWHRVRYFLPPAPDIIIVIRKHGRYNIKVNKAYETRSISTAILFALGFQKAEESEAVLRPKRLNIYCDDYLHPSLLRKKNIYAYALPLSLGVPHRARRIPDFGFINWPGASIQSYNETCDQLVCLSRSEPELPGKMIWAGNSRTNPKRLELVRLSSSLSWLEVYDTSRGDPFMPMSEQIKYSYIIDIEGRGYSGRIKLMLFWCRPLFLQEREQVEWYHELLFPYIHFIPVKNDLSNLEEQYHWAERNPHESQAIAQRAQDFALANLRTSNAVDFIKDILVD